MTKPFSTILEVEFTNVTNLEGHTNYVDVCCLNPKVDTNMNFPFKSFND